ncbi:MAG: class I tRNA ligase family protein, partial [Candidatus Saccharimonadales bacterium]
GVKPPAGQGWEQDPDTLDTWFSSALWTWSTLINPELADDYSLSLEQLLDHSPDFKAYHPTSVMETGWDILFFWVARMILATTYATGQIPFKTVYLHGLVRTETGKKMSKSDPETIIDPMEVIPQYGTDALRLALVSGVGAGADQRLGKSKIVSNRNFCNKLWNIARYVEGAVSDKGGNPIPMRPADYWILDRLSVTSKLIEDNLADYKFFECYLIIYHFVWKDFADWYIEASKVQLNAPLLAYVLEETLKVVHPFAPFVTEAIWQQLNWSKKLLASELWPVVKTQPQDRQEAHKFDILTVIVDEIRWLKAATGIEPKRLYYHNLEAVKDDSQTLAYLTGLEEVEEVTEGYRKGLKLTWINFDAWLDVDVAKAKTSLEAKLREAQTEVSRLRARLEKPEYVAKAPRELVEQTKQDITVTQSTMDQLQRTLGTLES